jgi:hypothetical protein
MVFKDGAYDHITECRMTSEWDENGYQTALKAQVKTRAGKAYEVEGKVLSLIPLPAQDARRPGDHDAHHRGHDRVHVRRAGRLRPVGIPGPDRRRQTHGYGRRGGGVAMGTVSPLTWLILGGVLVAAVYLVWSLVFRKRPNRPPDQS